MFPTKEDIAKAMNMVDMFEGHPTYTSDDITVELYWMIIHDSAKPINLHSKTLKEDVAKSISSFCTHIRSGLCRIED